MSEKRVSDMTDEEVRELVGDDRPITYHEASRSDRTWLQARDQWEDLDRRHHLARAEAALKARGEWDPARHGAGGAQPLTLAEHLEVLANGEVVARVYRHPAQVEWAVQAGASWEQIAEAQGITQEQARQEYREWAGRSHWLWQRYEGRFGIDDDAYAAALARAGEPAAADDDQAVILAALAEAAASIRQRAAACTACETHPAALCDETANELRKAEAFSALAARLTGVSR